jgi:nicotinate-nucleotide adenylyltransferase
VTSEERLRRRIGVYGGTFDPIHNGHFKIAEAIVTAFRMDQMIFVPAFVPPHKRGREISSPFHRLAMLALATAESPRLLVSTIELEAPARPYTIETLQRIQLEQPDAQLLFVMGADSFKDVTTWREYERILSEYDVIVADRPGIRSDHQIVAHLPSNLQAQVIDLRGGLLPEDSSFAAPHIYLSDYVAVDLSATEIRERAAQKRDVAELVPSAVAAYIAKYHLYQ